MIGCLSNLLQDIVIRILNKGAVEIRNNTLVHTLSNPTEYGFNTYPDVQEPRLTVSSVNKACLHSSLVGKKAERVMR